MFLSISNPPLGISTAIDFYPFICNYNNMPESPDKSCPPSENNDTPTVSRRDMLKGALLMPFALSMDRITQAGDDQETGEKPTRKVKIETEFVGKGGPHRPARIQVDLGRNEKERPYLARDVRPGRTTSVELNLAQGKHTIDIRPLVTRESEEQVELSSMKQEVGFFTYRIPHDEGFTRYESGSTIDVKKNQKIKLEIEPLIEFKNLVGRIGNDARAWYLRRDKLAIKPNEKKHNSQGGFSIANEAGAVNFPYTIRVFKLEQEEGKINIELVNSFVSEDGSLPTLKEGDDTLEPGTYVFNVFANRPHYNQPSLVTLKDGKQEMHSRQLNFLGTPVEIKAGQQAKITVEQHNKPYNVAEGEFQTGDNKPSTCMMAIFPRGYPAMDDLDLKEDSFERAIQKSDLLTLHTKGREKFIEEQVSAVMETLFDENRENIHEWRKSFILYSRPDSEGNISDAVRGMSIDEYNDLGDDKKETHKAMVRARITEFLTKLFEDNMSQPYRSENAVSLLKNAREHLKDNSIKVAPMHMDKKEAVKRFAAAYIKMLEERE